jgi:hypothetical protein
MKVKTAKPEHAFGVWLPLFLLWPIALVFLVAAAVIMLPFALLATIFTLRVRHWRTLSSGTAAVVRVLCSLRGLTVDVEREGSRFELLFR